MAKKGGNNKGKDKKVAGPKVKKPRNLYELYEVKGDTLVRKNKFSPKSPGDFLANHKNRQTCGKTAYTEFAQKEAPKTEEKKEE